jgi:hypothetical protein
MTTTLGDALEAFSLEHEYCRELDSTVEADRAWMTCTCGAVIVRALEPVWLRAPRCQTDDGRARSA